MGIGVDKLVVFADGQTEYKLSRALVGVSSRVFTGVLSSRRVDVVDEPMADVYKVPEGEGELAPPPFSTRAFRDAQGRLAWVPHLIIGISVDRGDRLEANSRRALISSLMRQLFRRNPTYRSGTMQL